MIEGILTSFAADLIKVALTKGYHFLKGRPEQRAVETIYDDAFKEMRRVHLAVLDRKVQEHIVESLRPLINDPDVAEMLLKIIGKLEKPTLEQLAPYFKKYGFDSTTIAYFDTFSEAVLEGLRQEIRQHDSKLKNHVDDIRFETLLKRVSPPLTPLMPTCPTPERAPEKFAGRDLQMATLRQRLKDGQLTAITAVQGLAGIGKTTIALKIAHDLFNDQTFRAVLWTHVTRAPNTVNLLQDWAVRCGVAYPTEAGDIDQIAAALKGRIEQAIAQSCQESDGNRVLVVFDDVWDNGRETVEQLKQAMPHNATVLITTRSERAAYALNAGAGDLIRVDRLLGADGVAMLREYFPSGDESLLNDLVTALDGHALGLTIAIQRVLPKSTDRREAALQAQIDQYRAGLDDASIFAHLRLEDEAEDRNLTNVIAASYDELSADDQRRFRALGVLMPDAAFDLGLLSRLWDMDDLKAVETACDRLRLLALLQEAGAEKVQNTLEGNIWHTQPALLRAYARALLKQSGEWDATWNRYLDAVIWIAGYFLELQDKPEQWGWLTPYLPHIHPVGDWLARAAKAAPEDEALRDRALIFARHTYNYLNHRREVGRETTIGWLTMGLAAARADGDKAGEASFLNTLAVYHSEVGEGRQALVYYEQALDLHREVGDRGGEATALNNIGAIYLAEGNLEQALHHTSQALEILEQIGALYYAAMGCSNIGVLHYQLGNLDEAVRYLERAVDLMQQVEHPDLEQNRAFLERVRRERDGRT